MGKLDVIQLRELTSIHFRILVAVERGMQRHNYVPLDQVEVFARKGKSKTVKLLGELGKSRLVATADKNKKHNAGYRLTTSGYDYLGLKALLEKNVVAAFGNQIGVGKESDVYIVADDAGKEFALKFHRLGRTCFRQVLNKRDYHKRIKHTSWIYLSRIAAKKEFAFMKALYSRKLPVPEPIAWNRHCILMQYLDGVPLCEVRELEDPGAVYSECMELIVQLASWGVVHSDFNEFNLMLDSSNHITMIDFPQMVSTNHPDAEMYFNRDVECVKSFFRKRFRFDGDAAPVFTRDVKREGDLDREVEASGYDKRLQEMFDKEIARLNMNIPETEKRKLPIMRADNSEDEDEAEDDDDEDDDEDGAEEHVRSCEAALQSLSTEDCEGGALGPAEGEESQDTLDDDIREANLADQACGGSELSDDCVVEEEEEEEESDDSGQHASTSKNSPKRRGRSSASVCSSTSVLGPTRTEEIQHRIRKEMRRQKAKEDARILRKGAKSARNSKMRKDNRNDIKTSLSSVWF